MRRGNGRGTTREARVWATAAAAAGACSGRRTSRGMGKDRLRWAETRRRRKGGGRRGVEQQRSALLFRWKPRGGSSLRARAYLRRGWTFPPTFPQSRRVVRLPWARRRRQVPRRASAFGQRRRRGGGGRRSLRFAEFADLRRVGVGGGGLMFTDRSCPGGPCKRECLTTAARRCRWRARRRGAAPCAGCGGASGRPTRS